MAGLTPLAPQTIRLDQGEDAKLPIGDDLLIEVDEGSPEPDVDAAGNVLSIKFPDGSVEISLDGKGLGNVNAPANENKGWFANLSEDIDDSELGRIANDLLRGISDDDTSRQEWVEARKTGIQLLGLKVEIPGLQGSVDGAPVEGMSRVRHPLLLEAVLRFQANARSELLPTDGPVKLRNDDNNATLAEDQIANALETDLNHYLTATATEYYPDTDRMLLLLGFGGTTFKKVYFCPLRNRPVSETVDADDLIVTANATDLANARRVTHKVLMTPSTVKRMQILGFYRDIDLSTPQAPKMNDADREKAAQQGVNPDVINPEDRDREIYECYCELDIRGYEHKHKQKVSGLEIPYRVTIDVSTEQILSIVRNYNEDTKELPDKRVTFVKYTFVPGLGFYDIGLLHILGNTTNALSAAWREMLDNGMFANFPGFLMADQGARQNTNIFRVPPGGGALVKTNGLPINQAVMPLPYNTTHMAALQSLAGEMAETGMRVGGTSEQQVGEGRADAPVGTTLAMIDQATKILNSVHKRMHQAQATEFGLLVDCFREHPESFWQRNKKPAYPWDQETFVKALNDYDLVPQADPNTASQTQRVMKVMGLKQLASGPDGKMFDQKAVNSACMQTLGWNNPDQFFTKEDSQGQDPEIIKGIAQIQNDGKKADAALLSAQASMKSADANVAKSQQGLGAAQPPPQSEADVQDAQLKVEAQQLKVREQEHREQQAVVDDENRDLDRKVDEHIAFIGLAKEVLQDEKTAHKAEKEIKHVKKEVE